MIFTFWPCSLCLPFLARQRKIYEFKKKAENECMEVVEPQAPVELFQDLNEIDVFCFCEKLNQSGDKHILTSYLILFSPKTRKRPFMRNTWWRRAQWSPKRFSTCPHWRRYVYYCFFLDFSICFTKIGDKVSNELFFYTITKVEEAILEKKKKELLSKYVSDEMIQSEAEARLLAGKI